MPAPLGQMHVDEFLAEYWQKRPCLIRNAVPGFEPGLDGDDLAGLACEPSAEARIVSGSFPAHDWDLRYGPFDESDFARLPEKNWTLLVQDVEKHYPPLSELMEMFDFLPTWRLDDLMISWAAPGGSVGPHVDQYDVFLLQAQGTRRWQIAESFEPALLGDCALNVLRNFIPEQEWRLEPGDLLYLPPGVAHHGVAVTEGMTWSVGLRAPDAADLLMALGESLAGDDVPRYTDPDLRTISSPGEIDAMALGRLRGLMSEPLKDDEAFRHFAGRFLTRFRMAHEPAPPDHLPDSAELHAALKSGAPLFRNPWTRLAWVEHDGQALLFAAGDPFECSRELARTVCARQAPDLRSGDWSEDDIGVLVRLVETGHLVLFDQPD